MANWKDEVCACLDHVRRVTGLEFAALALSTGNHVYRWVCASGSRNGRLQRMVLKSGKGVIGRVISSGRSAVLRSFAPKSGDDPSDYSTLLAEGLVSLAAVPVWREQRVVGVLAVGSRSAREVGDAVLSCSHRAAERIAALLPRRVAG